MQSKNKESILVKRNYWRIGFILILALILRIISLNQSLWLDEAINLSAARDRTLTDLLFNYSIGDFHPPLYHLLLWIWFQLFPANEVFSRLPSVIFSIGTILLTYKIANKIFNNRKISLLTAFLLTTSGLHIYYSQEARMYSLASFFATSTFLSLLNLKDNPTWKNNALYAISLALLLLSDYQPWLLLPILFYFEPLISTIGLGLTIFWWPTLIKQIVVGLSTAQTFPLWKAVVGKLTLKSLLLVPIKFIVGRVSIENNIIFATVLIIPTSIIIYSFYLTYKRLNKNINIIYLWLFLPLFLGILISFWIPIFSYFRYLFLLPAFYLLISYGLYQIKTNRYKILVSILLLTNIISSTAYLFHNSFHRENWKGFVDYIASFSNKTDMVVFPSLAQAAGFKYYNKNGINVHDREQINFKENPKNVFLVRYVSEIFDPEDILLKSILENGYHKAEEKNFNGVVVWRFEK